MFVFSLDPTKEDAHILKEIPQDPMPRVVFGIRPCDARAFQLVDANFDTPSYQDPWWVNAREMTTFVGLGCTDPCSTCFCTAVEGGPFDTAGLDLLLTEVGEGFLVKVLTNKGEALVNTSDAFEPVSADLVEKAVPVEKTAARAIESQVDISRLASLDMTTLYEEPFWDDVAFSCINCGTCTFLCPTCWCFDIQDETHGAAGTRMRNWDSCMFPLFTLHASGHNPRSQKVQRVRQRFMHKLKYYVDTYEKGVACVGCGRCVQYCPVNIDIREVIRLMNDSGGSKVLDNG
jgi:ferredoxin